MSAPCALEGWPATCLLTPCPSHTLPTRAFAHSGPCTQSSLFLAFGPQFQVTSLAGLADHSEQQRHPLLASLTRQCLPPWATGLACQWSACFCLSSCSLPSPLSAGRHAPCVCAKPFHCVRLFATPWTVALQAPPSMGVSRQEYWRELPFLSPGDLPNPEIKPGSPVSPTLAG